MRRIQSAMLSAKPQKSPAKAADTKISPLKLALRRAQQAADERNKTITVPLNQTASNTSLIRNGMRNIFAPRFPAQSVPVPRQNTCVQAVNGRTAISISSEKFGGANEPTDIPKDLLRAVIFSSNSKSTRVVSPPSTSPPFLDLPVPPPMDRVVLRTPQRKAPAISLPPVPDVPTQRAIGEMISSTPPRIAFDLSSEKGARNFIFSDELTPGTKERRQSFDFTSEYAKLDRGDQRTSFVEALQRVVSMEMLSTQAVPRLELAPVLATTSLAIHEATRLLSEVQYSAYQYAPERGRSEEEEPSSAGTIRNRPVPFQGELAFQSRISKAREAHGQGFSLSAPPCELAFLAPVQPKRRGHKRGESGLSIATMSSLGDLVDTSIRGDFTNYFDIDFAEHLKRLSVMTTDSVDAASDICGLASEASETQASSQHVDATNPRAPTRRALRRRSPSIQSADSIDALLLCTIRDGPPVSMRNNRRSSYISCHRRSGSKDSGFGRPDWAAQGRHSSSGSVTSFHSAAYPGRPALGERMFQLDAGIKLSSIAGSPPDERASASHKRQRSEDSLLDESEAAFISLINSPVAHQDSHVKTPSIGSNSVFESDGSNLDHSFCFKGPEPASMISTSFISGSPLATRFNAARYSSQVNTPGVRGEETCLQGEGESITMISEAVRSHAGMPSLSRCTGPGQTPQLNERQLPNSSVVRSQKPRSAPRRRPVTLVFSDHPSETPGLSSPSASETSSRISLETRFSDSSSIFDARRNRPYAAGHYRQKSSAGVKLHATIREEPSTVTLRPTKISTSPKCVPAEPKIVSWDADQLEEGSMHTLKSWLEWQREAGDEYQKVKDEWVDSEESKHAVAGQSYISRGLETLMHLAEFKMPMTTQQISDFLAASSESYKPLDELPLGRIVHRRKSSLSDTRLLTSPYGLPLLKPPQAYKPKTSLITKFERTNSTNSSNFSFFAEDLPISAPTPVSAVFAPFAREHPPSPPPTIAAFVPFTPFQPMLDANNSQDQADQEGDKEKDEMRRSRVTSNARRQALGWGRRRNSDGPTKVQEAVKKIDNAAFVPANKDAPVPRVIAKKDRENVPHASLVPHRSRSRTIADDDSS